MMGRLTESCTRTLFSPSSFSTKTVTFSPVNCDSSSSEFEAWNEYQEATIDPVLKQIVTHRVLPSIQHHVIRDWWAPSHPLLESSKGYKQTAPLLGTFLPLQQCLRMEPSLSVLDYLTHLIKDFVPAYKYNDGHTNTNNDTKEKAQKHLPYSCYVLYSIDFRLYPNALHLLTATAKTTTGAKYDNIYRYW